MAKKGSPLCFQSRAYSIMRMRKLYKQITVCAAVVRMKNLSKDFISEMWVFVNDSRFCGECVVFWRRGARMCDTLKSRDMN